MKKLIHSQSATPRKLAMRRETVRVLRQLTLHDLRDIYSGATEADCNESTLQPWSVMCD